MGHLKILFLDIETAPHKVYAWGLWKQDINPNNVIEQGYTLCWAAKWKDHRGVMFDSIQKSKRIDMIKRIHELIEKADAVVHYNGTKFDMPILNQEFLFSQLPPPASYSDIDLLRTARQRFRLPSNKLDYLAQYMGLGQKEDMRLSDWHDCMDGDDRAWRKMERYNKKDVKLLEDVYNMLLPWVKQHPNWGHFMRADEDRPICAKCGSARVKKDGWERKTVVPYQRYRCTACKSPLKGRKKITHRPQPTTVSAT